MKTSWWIGIIMVFIITQLWANTMEAQASGVDMNFFQNIFQSRWVDFSNPLSAIVSIPIVTYLVISTLLGMLFFDYPTIFHGDWVWFRTILLWPLSIAFVWSTMMALKGTPSV